MSSKNLNIVKLTLDYLALWIRMKVEIIEKSILNT